MATIVASGTTIDVIDLILSSTDDIQVGFSTLVNTVIIKARTSVDMQVRQSRGASTYFTIPAGQSLALSLVGKSQDGASSPKNVWLRSTTGTPVAEILGIYGG